MRVATYRSTRNAVHEFLFSLPAFFLQLLLAYALHSTAAAGQGGVAQALPRISVDWNNTELGSAVERLRRIGNVCVWVDRRVDPHVRLTHAAKEEPLEAVLDAAVSRHGLRAMQFAGGLYVGPRQTAEALPALAAALRSEAPRPRRRWTKRQPIATPRGAQPRELLVEALQQADVTLTNPEAIPLDVWPQQDAGDTTLVEFTVLVLAGFDLRAAVSKDGRSIRAVAIDYAALDTTTATPRKRRRPARGPSNKAPARLYSLKIQDQPLIPVVEQLAQRTGTTVRWEPSIDAAGLRTNARVSVDVQQVSFDELMSALLRQAALRHRVEDGVIVVGPAG